MKVYRQAGYENVSTNEKIKCGNENVLTRSKTGHKNLGNVSTVTRL